MEDTQQVILDARMSHIIRSYKQNDNLFYAYGVDNIVFGMGIGDWGLGIGDWGLGIGPIPKSPIPNPQSPIPHPHFCNNCP